MAITTKNLRATWLLSLFLIWPVHGMAEEAKKAAIFRWEPPAGRYADPTSFFSLHGYADAVYGSFSRDWTASDPAKIQAPGQLLVPNSNNSAFQYDAALMIGSEINPRTSLFLEAHFISDPSGSGAAGPGGNTIALTETVVSWALIPSYLNLSGGLYWAPFAIINQDWLGAQNLFTLLPRASGAFPAHFNERGVRLDGSHAWTENAGVNYVFSYGNGVQSFDLGGQTAFDRNENKTVMGRVGVFPGLGKNLDVGYSIASGRLRQDADLTKTLGDPLRYPAYMVAHAVDATWQDKGLKVRSYYVHSRERLNAVPGGSAPDNLSRNGFVVEGSYDIALAGRILEIKKMTPKLRYDYIDVTGLNAGGVGSEHFRSAVYSAGINLYPHDRFYLSLEYHIQDELGRPKLSNNRFVARLTAMF